MLLKSVSVTNQYLRKLVIKRCGRITVDVVRVASVAVVSDDPTVVVPRFVLVMGSLLT